MSTRHSAAAGESLKKLTCRVQAVNAHLMARMAEAEEWIQVTETMVQAQRRRTRNTSSNSSPCSTCAQSK